MRGHGAQILWVFIIRGLDTIEHEQRTNLTLVIETHDIGLGETHEPTNPKRLHIEFARCDRRAILFARRHRAKRSAAQFVGGARTAQIAAQAPRRNGEHVVSTARVA